MLSILLCLFLCGSVLGTENKTDLCREVFEVHNISTIFPKAVAHSTHSITLDDLQFYFDENIGEENGVETVNLDLTGDPPILPNAPPAEMSPLVTRGFQTVDRVLSHMDNKNWMAKHYNTLERIVHAFHMQEIWTKASKAYQEFRDNPPNDEICDCVTDTDANGIHEELKKTALRLREPDLLYEYCKSTAKDRLEKKYRFRLYLLWRSKFAKQDIENECNYLPELENEASWDEWRDLLKPGEGDESVAKALGLYLYCKFVDLG